MKMFYYEWEDETLSVVVAQNKKEAFLILDEIGDADPEKIKRISSNEYIIAQGVGFVQFKISI